MEIERKAARTGNDSLARGGSGGHRRRGRAGGKRGVHRHNVCHGEREGMQCRWRGSSREKCGAEAASEDRVRAQLPHSACKRAVCGRFVFTSKGSASGRAAAFLSIGSLRFSPAATLSSSRRHTLIFRPLSMLVIDSSHLK